MKIVIPGGSGQIGSLLARVFRADGHEVAVISRDRTIPNAIVWDGETSGAWAKALDGADVVINLAGHTVNCRYHSKNRDRIMNSRTNSTRLVGDAIGHATCPPRVWLQASTATIYSHRYDAPNDETSGIIGGKEPDAPDTWKFSIEVATAWERTLDAADVPNTRKVKLRSAMTMSPDTGGIFDVLLGLVRRGLGGPSGDGRQYVSWVHYEDFIQAIYWLIEHEEIEGAVNVTSPNPLSNAEFMQAIRDAWGTRIGLPATRWMLELGAAFLRTETELILKSRRVVPGLLLQKGFVFRHPTWPEAARSLCREWRGRSATKSHDASPSS
ncbi:MAG: TIGR01777 family oxidoreductase [Phycisphaerales bacterium]|nr:TIGR01777 family oxidoreductase [Phycisphaerales bacterium]